MFGYVKIYKDELKIKEFNLFRAYYCGLCKALGRNSGQLTRLGLSYDMTFLALMLSSAYDTNVEIEREGCIKHIGRHPIVKENKIIEYTADMSVALAYFKLLDDINDEHSIKAFFALSVYFIPMRRVERKYKKEVGEIKTYLDKLSDLEKEKCSNIDMLADCFANILKILFTPSFLEYNENMAKLGYNLGRWIYIMDAYADIEKDKKKKLFNPITLAGIEKETIEQDLTFTLYNIGELAKAIPHKNASIIENIIYLGLRNIQDKVIKNESI